MKITKSRLKEIIQEELQNEGILSSFAANLAKRANKDKKQTKFIPRELTDKEKEISELVKTNKELVEKAIEKLQMSSNILTSPDAQNEEIANAIKEMDKARDALNALIIAKQPAYLKRLEEEKRRHPGEAPPETLDDLIRRAMAGGIDPYGGGAERFKKEIIRAVKEELGLKEASYGADGQMADSQLNTIVNLATKLDMIISDDTRLPNWVKSKITKALDYISTSLNYLIGEIADTQEEMMREEKLTKPQIKDRDKRAKKIMKSTKKQYGKEEGEDIAYAIATNQVKEET